MADGVRIPITRVPRQYGVVDSIDTSLDTNKEFAYLAQIGVGGQPFPMLFDTGSSDLWVVSSSCMVDDCQTILKYNGTTSSSLSDIPFHLQYLIGSVDGSLGTDTVAFGPFSITSQVLAFVNETSGLDLKGTGYSGILGLSFPGDASIPDTAGRTLSENVFAALDSDDRFFAFKLGKTETTSSFTVGQLDPTYANSSSDLTYTPVFKGRDSSFSYWRLPLLQLTVNSTVFHLSKSRIAGAPSPIAVLDTGTTLILGPTVDVDRFWTSIGGARKGDSGWQVRCDRAIVIGFVLGDENSQREYVMDPADISWEEGGRDGDWCVGGVQANDQVFSGDWLLGDTFLRNVYVTHHAATASQPPLIGLLNVTDPVSALSIFRDDRGEDLTPPAQVLSSATQPHEFSSADVCGVSVAAGFVLGAVLTLILLYTGMCRTKRSRY